MDFDLKLLLLFIKFLIGHSHRLKAFLGRGHTELDSAVQPKQALVYVTITMEMAEKCPTSDFQPWLTLSRFFSACFSHSLYKRLKAEIQKII